MPLSSDPHAWLRLYFEQLRQDDPQFARLAPSLQFEALYAAVRSDQPGRAEGMRDWSVAARHALLKWLADVVAERKPTRDERLWSITKGNRRLDCLAVYLPSGIDLRLMEGTEFRRTELFREASTLKARADEWRKAMFERGWIPVPESDLPGGAVRELSPKVRMV
jgi:hypothetical protein